MANEMFTEISPVLYENRYCSHGDFHITIDGLKHGLISRTRHGTVRNIYKVKYPNVIEKLDSISKFSYADVTVTSGLNIWTICAQRVVSERSAFRNSVETNALTNNLLQMPDDSVGFCVCSFMKNVYILADKYVPMVVH